MLFSWRVFSVSCGVSLSPLCDEFSHICALRLSLRKLTLIARLEDDHNEAWGRGGVANHRQLEKETKRNVKVRHSSSCKKPRPRNQKPGRTQTVSHPLPPWPASRPCQPPLLLSAPAHHASPNCVYIKTCWQHKHLFLFCLPPSSSPSLLE